MRIIILGATGNIGQQAIKVIKQNGFTLVGFSYYKNESLATQIANERNVQYIFSPTKKGISNVPSYRALIKKAKPDIVLNAIVGYAGLKATISAIKCGVTVALANKETLVVAGEIINKMARRYKVDIIPVDSEHAAIDELIHRFGSFSKLHITCSGGPFYGWNEDELQNVTYKQACSHPKWKMGEKISIDSATLMNKCFEIIEAKHLFQTTEIEAIYHPQAMVHSLITTNGKTYGLVSKPNMEGPIHYAIGNRKKSVQGKVEPIDLDNNVEYTFDRFDVGNLKPFIWAKKCTFLKRSSLPVVINAANEAAIELFKNNIINYVDIIKVIDDATKNFAKKRFFTLWQIHWMDRRVRTYVQKKWGNKCQKH